MSLVSAERRGLTPGAAGLLALTFVLTGCNTEPATPVQIPQGDPELGRQAAADRGCGSCHVIPGIRGANATVAAPLTDFGKRHYIAGKVPNNAENLVLWIENPQQIDPGTAMPDLGIPTQEAQDIAAYLLSLD